MRMRPTRHDSPIRISWITIAAAIAALLMLGDARPSAAEWEWDGSVPQKILSTTVDLSIVRPLSALRAGVGAILLVPAAILASPACGVNLVSGTDCGPVFEAPYDVLLGEPAEYAFRRKIGEL
jgi:hypothetical protein